MKFKNKSDKSVVEAEQFVIWDYSNVPNYVTLLGYTCEIKGKLFDRYIKVCAPKGILRLSVHDYLVNANGTLYVRNQLEFRREYEEIV